LHERHLQRQEMQIFSQKTAPMSRRRHRGPQRLRVVAVPGQADHRVSVPAGDEPGHPQHPAVTVTVNVSVPVVPAAGVESVEGV